MDDQAQIQVRIGAKLGYAVSLMLPAKAGCRQGMNQYYFRYFPILRGTKTLSAARGLCEDKSLSGWLVI